MLVKPIQQEGWPELIAEFRQTDWQQRALFVLNLPVAEMSPSAFREHMEACDCPVTAESLDERWDQRDVVALLWRIVDGIRWRGCAFDVNDLESFLDLVGSLRLEPLPGVTEGGEQILFEATPRTLTFGGQFWPSVGSAVLLLYLMMGDLVRDPLSVCRLATCRRVFLSQGGYCDFCSLACRVAASRLRRTQEDSNPSEGLS